MDFHDEIVCPYCGDVDYEHCDYPRDLRRDGDKTTLSCAECGKDFRVVLCVEYTYGTEKLSEVAP